MQHECTPQMFQNKYVILVSAAAQVESVRVLTYGFVGGPESGDRPDMKHTPFMLRLLTENLLSQEGTTLTANETAGQKITMKYSVSPTPAEAASSEIARDTRRMAYAIATGDFEHILEIDPEIAVAGDEDDKGFLWNVETSSYRRVLRVGSPSERTEWIDAVTTAALAQQSRSPVLDEDAISEALAAAVTYRDTSSQLREEMRKFRQASEATWEQWVATSTWAQDASRHAHPWVQVWESLDAAIDTDEELHDEITTVAKQPTSPGDRARARSRSPTIDVDLDDFIAAPVAVGQFTPSPDMAAAIVAVQTLVKECLANGDSQFKCAVSLLKAAIKCDGKQSKADGKERPLEAVLMYIQAAVCFAEVTNQKQRDAFAKKLPAVDERVCMALKTEREIFEELDEDKTGTLDESEFEMLMGRLSQPVHGSQDIFNEIDIDGSGMIDFDEFAVWSKRSGLRAQPVEFYRALCVLQNLPQPVEVNLNLLAAEMKRLSLPKSFAVAVSAADQATYEAAQAAAVAAALAPPMPIMVPSIGAQPDPEPELELEPSISPRLPASDAAVVEPMENLAHRHERSASVSSDLPVAPVATREMGENESPTARGDEDSAVATSLKEEQDSAEVSQLAEQVMAQKRVQALAEEDARQARIAEEQQLAEEQLTKEQAANDAAAAADATVAAAAAAAAAAIAEAATTAQAERDRLVEEEDKLKKADLVNAEATVKADEEVAAAAVKAKAQAEAERARLASEAEAEKAKQAAEAEAAAKPQEVAEPQPQSQSATLVAAIEANPDMWCNKCGAFFPGTICDAGHRNTWYRARGTIRTELDPAPAPRGQSGAETRMESHIYEFGQHRRKLLEHATTQRAGSAARLMEWSHARETGQAEWELQQRTACAMMATVGCTGNSATASRRQTEASWEEVTARRAARRRKQYGWVADGDHAVRSGSEWIRMWRTQSAPRSPPAPPPLSPRSPTTVMRELNTALDVFGLVSPGENSKHTHYGDGDTLEELAVLVRQVLQDLNQWRPDEPKAWLEDYFLRQCKPAAAPAPAPARGPFGSWLASTGTRVLLEKGFQQLVALDIGRTSRLHWLSEFVRTSSVGGI